MINVKKIEIELSSNCNAKCSGCKRTILDESGIDYIKQDISFDEIEQWFKDFDLTETNIKLCGVLGDPIINKDLCEIIFYLLFEKNVKNIEMSTNGGTRPSKFWEELGTLSSKSNKRFFIHWAIDGVTRNDYRENVNLDKVWENVDTYHSKGGHSIWQYILFDYNINELELAKKIAKEKNMLLVTRTSWRNNQYKAKFKSSKSKDIDKRMYEDLENVANRKIYNEPNISCRHKKENEIYIGSDGRLWPCCHLYDEFVSYDKKVFKILFKKYGIYFNSLLNNNINDILSHEWINGKLEESFNKDDELHFTRCYLSCGDCGKRSVRKELIG